MNAKTQTMFDEINVSHDFKIGEMENYGLDEMDRIEAEVADERRRKAFESFISRPNSEA